MKLDIGLLVTFLLMGTVSSVVPFVGPMFLAFGGSTHFLGKKSFSMELYSYLAFMSGVILVTWFLWLPEVEESLRFSGFATLLAVVSLSFLIGCLSNRYVDHS